VPSFCLLFALVFSGCEQKVDLDRSSSDPINEDTTIEVVSIDAAIAKGDLLMVEALIHSNPNIVNIGGRPEMPPLLSAILRKKIDIARLLIEKGAKVNVTDSSLRTAVHLAVDRNLPELIPLLKEHGAKLNELDSVGWTPLHWAAAKDRVEVARALIDAGADLRVISKLGGSALHEAASSGSAKMIELLLEVGVDPNVIASDGGTALDVAREYDNAAAIELLEPITKPKS